MFIPKANGRQRPLGVLTMEDKIVERALVEGTNAIHEVDVLGFSCGSRPGWSQHGALDAAAVRLTRREASWVLDAGIRGLFDTLDPTQRIPFVERRIADPRAVRLLRRWRSAAAVHDEVCTVSEVGTPRGGSASPLLAIIHRHDGLDLWADPWRRWRARGDANIVRGWFRSLGPVEGAVGDHGCCSDLPQTRGSLGSDSFLSGQESPGSRPSPFLLVGAGVEDARSLESTSTASSRTWSSLASPCGGRLREAAFAQRDLSGASFAGCDLTGAGIRHAKRVQTDFGGGGHVPRRRDVHAEVHPGRR